MYRKIAEGWRQNTGRRIGAGLTAVVIGIAGCQATPGHTQAETDANWAGVVAWGLKTGSASPTLTPQERTVGLATADMYDQSARDQAIRDSGGNVTVNIDGRNSQQSVRQIKFFTCKSYEINPRGRGGADFSDITNIFYPGDQIICVAENLPAGLGRNLLICVDNPDVKFDGRDKTGYDDGPAIGIGGFDASYLSQFGSHFKCEWSRQGQVYGYNEFVIIKEDKK